MVAGKVQALQAGQLLDLEHLCDAVLADVELLKALHRMRNV